MLESLNRGSTLTLLAELVQAIERHCDRLTHQPADSGNALRTELLPLLRKLAVQQERDLQTTYAAHATQVAAIISERVEARIEALFEKKRKRRIKWRTWLGLLCALILCTLIALVTGFLLGRYGLTRV